MKKATIIKVILGAALGMAPLLGNRASADVQGGDYAGSCSPHDATGSKGNSYFFDCNHTKGNNNYYRSVACSLSSDCYNYGYKPNVGTCSGSRYVEGTSTQTASHALNPAWNLWSCQDKKVNGSSQTCGGSDHTGTNYKFMCLSNYCQSSNHSCQPNRSNGQTCINYYACKHDVGYPACDGGYCKLVEGESCHSPYGNYYQCVSGAPCTAIGKSPGVCKPGDSCFCGSAM